MSYEPYLGSIEWVSFNFAPRGWALCDGQMMAINQNQGLFALLGTMYGGNGITTFALPDLRGRTPIGVIPGFSSGGVSQGQMLGTETHTLSSGEMPFHTHDGVPRTSDARATTGSVSGPGLMLGGGSRAYVDAELANNDLAADGRGRAGGSQPHNNMQPYLTLNAIIATQGVFPSRP